MTARKPSRSARPHLRLVRRDEKAQPHDQNSQPPSVRRSGAATPPRRDDGAEPASDLRDLIKRIDTEAIAEQNRATRSARHRLVFLTLLVLLFCAWLAWN